MQKVLQKHIEVFPTKQRPISRCSLYKHHIQAGDALPLKQAPHCKSYEVKEFLREHAKKVLKMGMIEQIISPWGTPVLVVRKKSGGLRIAYGSRLP